MATITFDESHKTVLSVKAEKNEIVEIPKGVTTLGEFCFFDCFDISVVIPSSVTSIDDTAFGGSRFTSIVVKSGNKIYDSRNNCNALIETATNTMIKGCENTIIPESVTSLGYDCFAFSGIDSIDIPEGVTSIGFGCFDFSGITHLTIPDSVTFIGPGFAECDRLASIAVKPGNKIYDSRDKCNAIIETATNTMIRGCKNTIIPESVTSLGDHCFAYCSITNIDIPEGVTSIGTGCFRYSAITHITISESVTSLGDNCFAYCSNLTKIIIPDSVKKIASDCFVGCDSLKDLEIPKGCEYEPHVGLGELLHDNI